MPKKNPKQKYTSDMQQVDKNTTTIALMQKDLDYMRKGIDDIRDTVKDLRHDLANGFVSKDQLKTVINDIESIEVRIKSLEKEKDFVVRIVIGSVIAALLALLGLSI